MSLYLRRRQLLDELPPADAERYGSLAWVLVDSGYCGIAIWYGKSKRPKRYRFRHAGHRQDWLDSAKRLDDQVTADKQKRKASKAAGAAAMADQIQVGTLLHYSWGWEQTNCDFFQVVAKSGRRVTIREIGSRVVPGSEVSHGMADSRMPARDQFVGPPIVKTINAHGLSMPHGLATPCADDSKHYCSWYA